MAEEYSRHLARVVVAQTAESTGFEAVQTSALEVLADLLLCYISQLGSASSGYAQQAGRTDTNVNDLVGTDPLSLHPAQDALLCGMPGCQLPVLMWWPVCSCWPARTWASPWTA